MLRPQQRKSLMRYTMGRLNSNMGLLLVLGGVMVVSFLIMNSMRSDIKMDSGNVEIKSGTPMTNGMSDSDGPVRGLGGFNGATDEDSAGTLDDIMQMGDSFVDTEPASDGFADQFSAEEEDILGKSVQGGASDVSEPDGVAVAEQLPGDGEAGSTDFPINASVSLPTADDSSQLGVAIVESPAVNLPDGSTGVESAVGETPAVPGAPVATVGDSTLIPPVGGSVPVDGAAVNPPVAPIDGAAVNPPAAPIDGAAVNPPAAPIDGAAAVSPVIPGLPAPPAGSENPLDKDSELDLYIPEGPDKFGKTISFTPLDNERFESKNINMDEVDFSGLEEQMPECRNTMSPPKTFIFIMSSHTGSTAMMSQLLRHPDLHWLHGVGTTELLNRPGILGNEEAEVKFTRGYFSDSVKIGKVGGFKMNPTAILRNAEQWRKLSSDYETGVIFNYRKNMFKRSVGRFPYYFLNDETAIAGVKAGTSMEERCAQGVGCTFKVEPYRLHCLLARSQQNYNDMYRAVEELTTKAGRPACVLNVPYEDYLEHPDEVLLQMEKFLNLRPFLTDTWRDKATSDNMCDVVENYAEMCSHFRDCSKWGWMLEDPANNCSCANYEYASMGGDGVNPLCGTDYLPEIRAECPF